MTEPASVSSIVSGSSSPRGLSYRYEPYVSLFDDPPALDEENAPLEVTEAAT